MGKTGGKPTAPASGPSAIGGDSAIRGDSTIGGGRAIRGVAALAALAICASLCACGSTTSSPASASAITPRADLAEARANAVAVSPLPGTEDASPDTQISFLGRPGTTVADVSVVGSRSGEHSGTLERYSTGTGASFVVSKPFQEGEQVAVHALVGVGSAAPEQPVTSVFTVAHQAPVVGRAEPPNGSNHPSNHPGYHPGDHPRNPSDVRRHASAPPAHTVVLRAGNGYGADPQEILLTPGDTARGTARGTVWVDVLDPIRAIPTTVGEPRGGVLVDSVIQEIDVKTGLVMWEWHALGHIPPHASRNPSASDGGPWGYIRIDSAGVGDENHNPANDVPITVRASGASYDVEIRTGATRRQSGARHPPPEHRGATRRRGTGRHPPRGAVSHRVRARAIV